MAVPKTIWLYHITHISNLPGIVLSGGLWPNNQIAAQGQHYTNIAHGGIQTRRHSKIVPCGPGGVLHDYVPFYFCRRSPMLYAINKGRVEGYEGGQAEVVYLVSKLDVVEQQGLPWVFTDGHAAMAISEFYEDVWELSEVDWPLMKAQFWHDTDEHPDRARRRQAEFLVHGHFPLGCVVGIAAYDAAMQARVEALLKANGANPMLKVVPKPGWYY